MSNLANIAGMATATTGTGTVTLGSRLEGHLTFADAGIVTGQTVSYSIIDGTETEVGRGVYTSSGTTLTRSVLKSTNSDALISLSGNAEVRIAALKEDLRPKFNGASGQLTGISTGSFATKGITWTPRIDVTIDALWGVIDAGGAGQNHAAIIASVNTQASATIVAVIGTSPSVASSSTIPEAYRFPFTTALSLTAGTPYLIAVVNQSGVGTTPCRIGDIDLTNLFWELNAPGSVRGGGAFDYNTTTLSPSQAPSSSGSGFRHGVWLEGSET